MSFRANVRRRLVLMWLVVPVTCLLTGMATSYVLVGDVWRFTWLSVWLAVLWCATATADIRHHSRRSTH